MGEGGGGNISTQETSSEWQFYRRKCLVDEKGQIRMVRLVWDDGEWQLWSRMMNLKANRLQQHKTTLSSTMSGSKRNQRL